MQDQARARARGRAGVACLYAEMPVAEVGRGQRAAETAIGSRAGWKRRRARASIYNDGRPMGGERAAAQDIHVLQCARPRAKASSMCRRQPAYQELLPHEKLLPQVPIRLFRNRSYSAIVAVRNHLVSRSL